jgi:hypothetical protein
MVTQATKTLAKCPRCGITCYLVDTHCRKCSEECGLNFRPAGDIDIKYPSVASFESVFRHTAGGGERVIRKHILDD